MKRVASTAAALLLLGALGCDSRRSVIGADIVAPLPRRTVVWLGAEGIDGDTAMRLQAAGVDQLVVHRGSINLAGDVPVFRLIPSPPVSGSIPVAIALRVDGVRAKLGEEMAAASWRAIAAEMGDATPAEIVLDLTEVADGLDDFMDALSAKAEVPVVPVLSPEQLRSPHAVRAVAAVHGCIVPIAGAGYPTVRGVHDLATLPLSGRLEPLAELGVRVRFAISLRPITSPHVPGWGDDLDPLTEPDNAKVKTTSELDRTIVFDREMEWSGREWQSGDAVAVRWFDISRLNDAFEEISRIVLPEVGGWDLIPLPPAGPRLATSRDALIQYLEGEGPEPDVQVQIQRNGTKLTLTVSNPSPFTSAVSGISNWFEVSVPSGSLVAESRGGFDRLALGTREGDDWQPKFLGAPNAVRFSENYLAPGEELTSGTIRLKSRRSQPRVRWHVLLSSGQEVVGEFTP